VPNQTARRSQQQRRSETEQRVLTAAMALIAERGSRGVSLAEVGRLAGYSSWHGHALDRRYAGRVPGVGRRWRCRPVPAICMLGRLLIAWVQDPDGHPIQIVQRLLDA
jgi:hypothetical protein